MAAKKVEGEPINDNMDTVQVDVKLLAEDDISIASCVGNVSLPLGERIRWRNLVVEFHRL
ncbi:MAG TPA: hypothetical protein DDW52_21890 [Planctomycetaceae bacterium]|nr:hypothetical protein [Planctomycetaceae bacterium]